MSCLQRHSIPVDGGQGVGYVMPPETQHSSGWWTSSGLCLVSRDTAYQ